MGREHKEKKVAEQVDAYLELALGDDSLPLNVKAVTEYIRCSRSAIYTYDGLKDKIHAAAEQRKMADKKQREPMQRQLNEALEAIATLQARLCLVELNAIRLNINSNELYRSA